MNDDLIRPEDRDRPIDSADFVVLGSFSHQGITYSAGEPVPGMTHGELERHLRSGAVRRRLPDGSFSERPLNEVRGPMDILRQADHLVFRALRQKPQTADDLIIIREQARREGRSLILQEALQYVHELVREIEAFEDAAAQPNNHQAADADEGHEPTPQAGTTTKPKSRRRARS